MLFENRTKEQSLTLFCSVCSEFLARYKCCSDSCSCSFPLPSQQLHNLSQLPCILTQYPLNTSYRRRHNMFSIWVVKKSEGNGKKNLGKKKNPVILYNYENVDSRTTHDYASKPSSWNDKIHGWIPFREWFFSQLILCIIFWN